MHRIVITIAFVLAGLSCATAGAQGNGGTSSNGAPGVVEKVEHAVERGAHAAASGIERGVKAAASGVERGVKAAASGVERGARAAASGVARGVKAAASGVERGAQATSHAVEGVAGKVTGSPASAAQK